MYKKIECSLSYLIVVAKILNEMKRRIKIMSKVQTLLVVWQDENSRSYYHKGTLTYYNGLYEFTYTSKNGKKQLGDALKNGYMVHQAFPDTTKFYHSKTLFPAFDRRIPSSDRKDYYEILVDLGLNENASKMD